MILEKNKIYNNFKYLLNNWWLWEKKSLFFVVIRILSQVFLSATTAIVPKVIIDCIVKNKTSTEMVYSIVIISMIIAFLSWLSPYMYEQLAGVAQIIKKRYSILLFEKTIELDYSCLETLKGRQNLEKAKKFTEGYISPCILFNYVFVNICMDIVGILSYLIILWKIDAVIILIIFLTCLLELLCLLCTQKYCREIINVESKYNIIYKYVLSVSQNINMGKDIRLYGFDKIFNELLGSANNTYLNKLEDLTKKKCYLVVIRCIFAVLREAIAYIYLSKLALKGIISVSDFIFYFGIVTGFSSWLVDFSEQIKEIVNCCDCCNDYRDFVDSKREPISQIPEKIESEKPFITSFVELKNLCFSYNKTDGKVLNNINLKIERNQKIAIVGENGAGKTTLVKVLVGLYEPTSGDIFFDEKNRKDMDKSNYIKYFSVVFQDYYFYPMSIRENLTFQEIHDEKQLNKSLVEAGLVDIINSLPNGIESKMIKKISSNAVDFSGGEAQKLVLARAIYRDASIFIFDEPTSALDPIAENEFYNMINSVTKDKTTIYISHRLSSTRFCDKIIFMKNGEIIEQGNHEELMELKGYYYKMYLMQSYYYKEEGRTVEKNS